MEMLLLASGFIVIFTLMVLSDADVWIILCIIALVLISFFLGRNSVLKELPKPKKMTINYEFRDSVYVPIDTVINNN